jgi:hypothetical protein
VPIFYEGRLPELRVLGNTLDKLFDRVFADRTDEEREAIKKKYTTENAIAEAPSRIGRSASTSSSTLKNTSRRTASRRRSSP